MNELKKFEFEGNEITFLTGSNTMINATEMAKPFDVKPNFWLKNDSVQRLIKCRAESRKINSTDLVEVRYGDNGGTWMHEDIALPFAQWLSPDFYFWCNDRIKELFKYGITSAIPQVRETLFKLSESVYKIQAQSPYKIGKNKLYEEMRQRGILKIHNIPDQKYIDLGYFKMLYYHEDGYTRYPVVTEDGLKWLTQLLFPDSSDNGKIQILEEKVNLLLSGIELMTEHFLIAKSGANNNIEQSKIVTEKMRDFCVKVKKITQELPTVLPNPVQLTIHTLDKY